MKIMIKDGTELLLIPETTTDLATITDFLHFEDVEGLQIDMNGGIYDIPEALCIGVRESC